MLLFHLEPLIYSKNFLPILFKQTSYTQIQKIYNNKYIFVHYNAGKWTLPQVFNQLSNNDYNFEYAAYQYCDSDGNGFLRIYEKGTNITSVDVSIPDNTKFRVIVG